MDDEQDAAVSRRRVRDDVVLAAAVAVALVAVWAAFKWVIDDAELTLEYVSALAWPIVALVVFISLRRPIYAKVADLLKVSGFGIGAEFTEARTKELGNDLGPDITALLSTDIDFVKVFEDALKGDDLEEQPPDGEAGPSDASAEGSVPTVDAPIKEPVVPDVQQPVPVPAGEGLSEEHIADLLGVLASLDIAEDIRRRTEQELHSADADQTRHEVVRLVEAVTKDRINAWAHRQRQHEEQTRSSIESVIQKSASWGYDMGKAGAPPTTPDIEWDADGGWRITTDVPARKPDSGQARARSAVQAQAERDRLRHIDYLVAEIKSRESQPMYMLGRRDDYLQELKRRLTVIDPGNPYALDRRFGI